MVKSKNFRQYLVKVIGLTVFIPLVVLALVSHVNINRLIDSIEAEQRNTAQFVSAGIDKQVHSAESLLAYASELLSERQRISPDEMTTSLRFMRERFPEFLNLHIDNAQGECIAFVSDDPSNDRKQIGSSHKTRWHYLKQQQNAGQHISDVFQGKGGTDEWIVSLTSAVLGKDGKPIAYVNGALNLHKIAARSLREESRHFKIAITDRQHQVIWTNVPEMSIGSNFLTNRELPETFGASTASRATGWYVYVDSKQDTVKKNDNIILAFLIFVLTGVFSVVAGKLAAKPLAGTVDALSNEVQAGVGSKTIDFLPVELERLRNAWLSAVGARDRARAEVEAINRDLELLVEERTARLESQKLLMESLISSLNDLVFLYDDRNVVVLANQRASDCLDVRVGEDWLVTLSQHFEKPGETLVSEVKQRIRTRDGRVYDFIPLKVIPNERGANAINGMLLRDVTERAALDDLRSSLVSVVAHEMKTPLASLQLQIPLLTNVVDKKTRAFTELLGEIEESTESLSRLINDWLDWSRLENNTLYVVPRLIRIDNVLRKAAKLVCQHDALEVVPDTSCIGVMAYADPIRLQQVFINLMTNAVRYRSSEAPRIQVSIRKEENLVEIAIADNGIGIPATEREKVFDCFYQIDMSSTRRQGGTGMGLAISRGIMRALGGDIRVAANDVETRGTTFLLRLPRISPQDTETESE